MGGPVDIPGDQLRTIVERIEHIEQEISELNEGKKEVDCDAPAPFFRTSELAIQPHRPQSTSATQQPEAIIACHRSRRCHALCPRSPNSNERIANEAQRCCSWQVTWPQNRLVPNTGYYLDNRLHKLSPIIPSARQAAIKPKTSVVNIGSPSATFLPPVAVELTPPEFRGLIAGFVAAGFDFVRRRI